MNASYTVPDTYGRPAQEEPTILVVDDDPHIRRMLCWALEEEGLEAEAVPDGETALHVLERKRPALVLLDMRLPVLDGQRVAQQLRAHHATLPIVVMTADSDAAEQARRVGARAYFRKPFDLNRLLATVQEVVVGK